MNKTIAEARSLVAEMAPKLRDVKGVEKVLCPPYTALFPISALLQGTDIGLGAQNLFWEEKGAYTGEIAPAMVAEFCQYVILGHSERRKYFGETDETVNKRLMAAFKANLIPIVCVGEREDEYDAKMTEAVVVKQVREGLKNLTAEQAARVVIAYEPVWAIGTGKAADGQYAETVVRDYIRKPYAAMVGESAAQAVRVLYGGSVTGANAAEFFGQADIDGALVGGASLKVDDFLAIVKAAVK
jgi:triosephosphate isomerase (TIM)